MKTEKNMDILAVKIFAANVVETRLFEGLSTNNKKLYSVSTFKFIFHFAYRSTVNI